MPYPHAIRLRGPWQYQPLARSVQIDGRRDEVTEALPPPGSLKLPQSWGAALGADFRGRVRFSRNFSQPTNLDAQERVWLVCEGVDHRGSFSLNDVPLGSVEGYALPVAFDITENLRPRNQLAVEVECPADPQGRLLRPGREPLAGGLVGDVRLEVRRGAFLDHLALSVQPGASGAPTLELQGHVTALTESADLALVATAMRREVVYEPVTAGSTFRIAAPVQGLPEWLPGRGGPLTEAHGVEVKLISHGVALWQATRQTAVRACGWRGELLYVGAEAVEIPTAATEFPDEPPTPALFRQVLGSPPRNLIRSRRILPRDYYQAFDLAGIAVVQEVPQPWWAAVRSRMAHHPSVILSAT